MGPLTFFLHVRRNMGRNRGRTLAVVVVVGITLGSFLILGQIDASVVAYTNQVVASVPDIVAVLPSQVTLGGGEVTVGNGSGGQGVINASALGTVESTRGVLAVQRIYLGPGPSLASSCEYGTRVLSEDTTSPVTLIGTGLTGVTSPVITSGRNLDAADENTTNALIGQTYASDAHLGVGDSLSIGASTFTVVGIFQASRPCEGDFVVLPYPAGAKAQRAAGPEILYLYISHALNTDAFVSSLQSSLGSSYNVEGLSTADYAALQNAISSILTFSGVGEYTALGAGAATIMVVMTLVTSRRTREIGLLKALGYSRRRILGQVVAESLIIALLGYPLAVALALIAGPTLAEGLLGSAANAGPSVRFLQGVGFSLALGTLILGAAIAVSFGLLGALYPTARALFLRPSEALRHE